MIPSTIKVMSDLGHTGKGIEEIKLFVRVCLTKDPVYSCSGVALVNPKLRNVAVYALSSLEEGDYEGDAVYFPVVRIEDISQVRMVPIEAEV